MLTSHISETKPSSVQADIKSSHRETPDLECLIRLILVRQQSILHTMAQLQSDVAQIREQQAETRKEICSLSTSSLL